MRITSIKLENLKGQTCAYSVAPVTVLVGAPFSGKTAVLDGIRVGLLGFHPKLGKRPGDTFKLATGTSMSVTLTLDGDISLSRSLASHRGTVHLRTTGEAPEVSAVLFDLNEYLTLSAKQRLSYVAAQVQPGDDDDFNPMTVLMELRDGTWESDKAEVGEAIDELQTFITDLNTARITEEVGLDDFFSTLLGQLGDKTKAAKAGVAQTTALIQGTSELTKGAAPPVNVERELIAARDNLTKMEATQASFLEAKKCETKHGETIARLTQWLKANEPKETKAAQEKAVRLERAFEELVEANGSEETLVRRLGDLRQDQRIAENQLNKFNQERAVATGARKKLDADWATYEGLDKCPYCKSNRAGWRDHLKTEHDAKVMRAEAELQKFTPDKLAPLSERAGSVAVQVTALEKLLSKIRETQGELVTAKGELNDVNEANVAYRDEVVRLDTLKENPPAPPPFPPSNAEVDTVQKLVNDLDRRQRLFVGEQAKAGQSAKAAKQLRLSKAKQEVFARAERALFKLHEDAVHKGVKSLIETACKFTDGIMPGKLEFLEGEIGYMKNGTWVSHEVFSGTETALAYAGFAVALNQQCPIRLVVMDELWCAGDLAPKVVERMAQLVEEGVIDQFVGAAPTPSMASKFKKAGATVLAVE